MKKAEMIVSVVGAMAGAAAVKAGFHTALAGVLQLDVHGVGFSLEILGGLFSIVLAFTIFVVWEQFNRVQEGIAAEAAALEDVCRIAGGIVDRTRLSPLKIMVTDYLRASLAEEPEKLAKGETSHIAERHFNQVCNYLRTLDVQSARDMVVYAELLRAVTRASDARDERLSVSATRIPRTLWWLLVFTGTILICGFLLLGLHSLLMSAALTGALAGVVCLLLIVVDDMDNPFSGAWNISYGPFQVIQHRIEEL